mmetsp:Transcript_26378/g.62812  ORF Transcript_26378/g.62812 Transcript_26378/m.62812 type:complete len:114 (+) Transcript_26378:1431-1772(+)
MWRISLLLSLLTLINTILCSIFDMICSVFWDDLGVARKIFRDLAELSEDGDLDGFHLPTQLSIDDHDDQHDDSPGLLHDLDEHSNEIADDPEDEEKPRPKPSKRSARKKRPVS